MSSRYPITFTTYFSVRAAETRSYLNYAILWALREVDEKNKRQF